MQLGYFPGDNEFHCVAGQTVSAPELGFLFPAFDDRSANIYNALFYSRQPGELHQEFIDAVFHTAPPMSAAEQREAVEAALCATLDCSLEIVQAVHAQLRERIELHKESKSPEPLEVSIREMGQILQSCGVAEEQAAAFREKCEEQFGAGAALNPLNLIDTNHFEIKVGEAAISLPPEDSYQVEMRTIEGRKYLLLPAGHEVEVNGLSIALRDTIDT